MWKIALLFFIFFLATEILLAQVPRKYVVVEIGTGTWCSFCPGAARGADDLIANGKHVAVIENHTGDYFSNSFSNTRINYYGITGFPTAIFDGANQLLGGSYTDSMYKPYLENYELAIAKMSDFTVALSYEREGSNYDVTIVLDELGNYTNDIIKVRLALTEYHILYNWLGMTELNFVNRAMYPSVDGISYSGGSETFNIHFTPDPSWNTDECELIAFIQDETTKEILQADKVSLLEPLGTNNAKLLDLSASDVCGTISPTLKLNNLGTDDITSLSIDYSINSGTETGNVSWTGTIPFNEINYINLNIPISDVLENNTLDLEIVEVNGTNDDDMSNNQLSTTFGKAIEQNDGYIKITIKTDIFGEETTWEIVDSDNIVVANGGPYTNGVIESYDEVLNLTADCYTFIMKDSGNNGGGWFIIKGTSGTMYYSIGDDYEGMTTRNFKIQNLATIEENKFPESIIYPNPANNTLNVENTEGLSIKLCDLLGRELFSKDKISTQEQINLEGIANGTYFIVLSDGYKSQTEKVIISK